MQEYRNDKLVVRYDPAICIHAGECVLDASSRQGRVRSLSSASSSLRIARFGKSLLADVLDFGVNVRTPAQACAHSTGGGVIMRVFYFAVGLVI
jgi:hypothetical protein